MLLALLLLVGCGGGSGGVPRAKADAEVCAAGKRMVDANDPGLSPFIELGNTKASPAIYRAAQVVIQDTDPGNAYAAVEPLRTALADLHRVCGTHWR